MAQPQLNERSYCNRPKKAGGTCRIVTAHFDLPESIPPAPCLIHGSDEELAFYAALRKIRADALSQADQEIEKIRKAAFTQIEKIRRAAFKQGMRAQRKLQKQQDTHRLESVHNRAFRAGIRAQQKQDAEYANRLQNRNVTGTTPTPTSQVIT